MMGFGVPNFKSGHIFITPAIYERLDEMTSSLAGKDRRDAVMLGVGAVNSLAAVKW